MPAEQVAAILLLEMTPGQRAECDSAKKTKSCKATVTCCDHIARRADSACAIVTPSAYSRSPPTGSPRAMRDTVR